MLKFNEAFHQTLAVLTVILNELCLGIGTGWTAPSLIVLQKSSGPLALTLEECSWIASLEHFGKMFGALLSAFLLDRIGRKPILIACSAVFFLQWPLILFANSVLALYASRIVFGIAWGLNDGANSVYLGENSSPVIRGIFGSISLSTYFLAVMVELIIASHFSYHTTATVNTALTFLTFLAVFWLKEPVQFLLMKGRLKQAEENFMWLKGVTNVEDVKHEFEKIKQNVYVENSKKSSLKKVIASPANYKSLSIIFVIYTLAASTGYFSIMSFATMSFAETNIFSSAELTILLGVSQFLVVTTTSFLIGRFSRRSILLISFSIMSLSHICSAVLYYVQLNIVEIPHFPWLIFLSITLFACTHAFMYPAFFLIRSELFPLSIKAVGGCLSVIGYGASTFLTTKIFLWIFASFGLYMNFVMFAGISSTLVIFIYFALPETRNKSLLEIQELLEKEN